MDPAMITGHLILMMGPTGSGKSSIVTYLLRHFSELHFSVSCTTRVPRPGERDGVEYYFISRADFEEKIRAGEFLEWAEFSGNLYGTLRSEVTTRLTSGQILITEIEVQGVLQLMQLIPAEHRTIIFIDAGDWSTLRARAKARAPISDEELALRQARYTEEIKSKSYADVIIDNTDGHLEATNEQMVTLVSAIIANVTSST